MKRMHYPLLFLSFLALAPTLTYCAKPAAGQDAPSLKDYPFQGAGVLPVVSITSKDQFIPVPGTAFVIPNLKNETPYLLIGLERSGKWGSFGGRKDPNEKHPETTAAREFNEETNFALFPNGASGLSQAIKYINADGENTQQVVANRGGVTYMTKFSLHDINKILSNFYSKQPTSKRKEISALGLVNFQKFLEMAAKGKTKIMAHTINEDGTRSYKEIEIRPFMVTVLKPFILEEMHKPNIKGVKGKNSKIIFYDFEEQKKKASAASQ